MIRVREEAGKGLHVASVETAVGGGQGVPGRDPVGPGRQLRTIGQHPHVHLAPEGLFSPPVPTGVKRAAIALDPLGGCLVGRVARPGAEVEEEGLFRVDDPQVPHARDGLVDEVRREVVALLGAVRGEHRMVVPDEVGHELVRLARHEPVEAFKTAAERPAGAAGPGVTLVLWGEVPLADGVRRVMGLDQHF